LWLDIAQSIRERTEKKREKPSFPGASLKRKIE
jgi:hypothetical protein